jgi:hypothetical protein
MIEFPMILLAGVLGSSHCLGMCGGFALILGSGASTLGSNLLRQTVYTAGRVSTYALLGGSAGYGGWRLTKIAGSLVDAQAVLAIAAGGLLIVEGLFAAGLFPRLRNRLEVNSCGAAGAFRGILTAPSLQSVFAAGLLNGLLPCGLVYAFLALAGSSGCLLWGATTMAVFGVGTAPAMLLAGFSGSVLGQSARGRVLRVAAWCVVLTGALTIVRGTGVVTLPRSLDRPVCAFCR